MKRHARNSNIIKTIDGIKGIFKGCEMTAQPLLKEDERYTYADYLSWDDDQRREIIEGVPYLMSPAPTWVHQEKNGELYRQFANFLKGKPCKVFHAPFDVRLFPADDNSDSTIVQPDIVVICNRSIIRGTGCAGAPDMVVEVLSPGTARLDRLVKFQLYQKAGVREYWIVDLETKTVSVHILKDGEYMTKAYGNADSAPVHVLEGLSINLADVFADDETDA